MNTGMRTEMFCLLAAWSCFAQPRPPNPTAQREAMKKLAFLAGTWSGEATATRPNQTIEVQQTEVSFKLDGLVLLIEGSGRNPHTREITYRALATISYDDAGGAYHFRAYNDGAYIDTELKVSANGFEWGYKAGPAQIAFVMKLDDSGNWVETGEITAGSAPTRRIFEMAVQKRKWSRFSRSG